MPAQEYSVAPARMAFSIFVRLPSYLLYVLNVTKAPSSIAASPKSNRVQTKGNGVTDKRPISPQQTESPMENLVFHCFQWMHVLVNQDLLTRPLVPRGDGIVPFPYDWDAVAVSSDLDPSNQPYAVFICSIWQEI